MTIDNKKSLIIFIVITIAAVILVNMISKNWFFRWDLTDNNMYSLSDSSKKVLDKIDDLLTMKVYFSENLPGEYGNNRRYLQDILEEYEAFSKGNIRFEFFPPDNDEKLEEDAQKYGIQPVQLQVIENDKVEIKKVYMGLVCIYEDKREAIPVIQTTTGLEYDITTTIKKLINDQKRTVGLATIGDQEVKNDNLRQTIGETYKVMPVSLSSPVPADIATLLINGVEDSLSTDEMTNLRQFVARGGNILIAQSRVKADIQQQTASGIQSNIFSLLDEYGLKLKENLVLDRQCGQVTISQNRGFFRMNSQVDYPFFPLVRSFGDNVMVKGLEQLRLLFTSEIEDLSPGVPDTLDSGNKLVPLLYTSDHSTTVEQFYNLNPIENPAFKNLNQPGRLVGALVDVTNDSTGSVGRVVLISDSNFLTDDGGGRIPENGIFVLNAVDVLMGDSDMVALRSREITTRPLKELEDSTKATWKWINILLPSLLVIAFGFLHWKREAGRAKVLEEIYE